MKTQYLNFRASSCSSSPYGGAGGTAMDDLRGPGVPAHPGAGQPCATDRDLGRRRWWDSDPEADEETEDTLGLLDTPQISPKT